MNNKRNLASRDIIGIWYAVAAFSAWGILSLYWKVLKQVPAGEILSHRIVWSFVFLAFILLLGNRWTDLQKVIANPANRLIIFLGALLISANWFIYIWAVNSNKVVEASLGYYITPLLNVLLGIVVLKERLNFWQLVSLTLAFIGVGILTTQYAQIPWVALSLALTFGLYGLVKKLASVEAIIGLTLETILIAPLAVSYLVWQHIQGVGSFGTASLTINLFLIGSGIITATPLLWFAEGAGRVSLSTLGFTQYLSPTISLLLGIFIFKEPFTRAHLLSFSCIWSALVLYTFSQTSLMDKWQPKYFRAVVKKGDI